MTAPDTLPAITDTAEFAYAIRRHALHMVHKANSSHIGGALSIADLVAVLYGQVLRVDPEDPNWTERDRFVLSKGHCCSVVYAALAMRGFFSVKDLDGYAQSGSLLMGHASHKVPGIEWSTGSLGHGLGVGCGQALAAQRKKKDWRVIVLASDGEMNEGSCWEAILFAGHHRLDNLTLIIDENRQQALGYTQDILDLKSLVEKFRAFNWSAVEIDGHDHDAILSALTQYPRDGRPLCIVAHTTKGKGVAYMEDSMEWHYKAPKTDELLKRALDELAEAYGKSSK